jgi:hypothetical protein
MLLNPLEIFKTEQLAQIKFGVWVEELVGYVVN